MTDPGRGVAPYGGMHRGPQLLASGLLAYGRGTQLRALIDCGGGRVGRETVEAQARRSRA